MSIKSHLATAALALGACSGLCAQSAVSGPTSGYIFTGGRFRPILGVPGSAHLGPSPSMKPKAPMHSEMRPPQFARVAPNGFSAITSGDKGVQFIADLSHPQDEQLAGAITPTAVFWANDSSAAALYSAKEHKLQYLALRPSITIRPPIQLDQLAAIGPPLAVNPTAELAAVCTGSGLAVIGAQGLMSTSVSCDGLSAGAFAGSTTLYVAGNGKVLEINSWQNGGAVTTLLETQGVQPIAAAAFDVPAGRSLLLLDASSNRLYVYDTTTATLTDQFDLDYSPSSLDLLGQATFLLNRDRKPYQPPLLFQILPKHAVSFVPVGD